MPTRSLSFLKSTPSACGLFGHEQRIGGGAGQHRRAEILHDHDLALGVAAGDRNDRGSQSFGAVMGTQAAGKQAVAVGVVDDVTLVGAGRNKRARHQLGPDVDILLGIADHGRFAGRAAGGMDADDLLHRRGKQAIGVGIAHILLGGERESSADRPGFLHQQA